MFIQNFQALEQFETLPVLISPLVFGYNVVLTNFNLTLSGVSVTFILLGMWSVYGSGFFTLNSSLVFESIYKFILSILVSQAGKRNEKFLPFMISLFIFILICNVVGLIPGNFCVTGQFFVTFTLSSCAFFGFVILSIQKQKSDFIWFFVPKNVPTVLLPFLVCIEVISYISRLFSLAIRLFANMVAGHALLHIIAGGLITGLKKVWFAKTILTVLMVLPVLLLLAIVGLESGIAFLQAYVFTVLVCIYLNDCYGAAH